MSTNHERRARVLLAADASRRCDTGLGRHQSHVAVELERIGIEVEILGSEDVVSKGPAGWRRFSFPWAVFKKARAAERRGAPYRAILVHEGAAGAVCAARKLGLLASRCIVVSHNPEQKVWELNLHLARNGVIHLPWKTRLLWPLTRLTQSNFALRHADRVACLSSEDAVFIRQRYGTNGNRLIRLHNGVSQDFFSRPAATGDARVLFLASWMRHKGTDALCPALTQLLQSQPLTTATLAGLGADAVTVLNVFPASVRSRVQVRPYVTPAELPELISRHNIFVLPSWYEGMPLSLLEAMATGLAVVVTNVGGMSDVVRSGVEGLVVAPHDSAQLFAAMQQLCADPQLRAEMGRAARQRATEFTWHSAAEILAGSILNENGARN